MFLFGHREERYTNRDILQYATIRGYNTYIYESKLIIEQISKRLSFYRNGLNQSRDN